MSLGFPKQQQQQQQPSALASTSHNTNHEEYNSNDPPYVYIPPKPLPTIPPYDSNCTIDVKQLTFSYNTNNAIATTPTTNGTTIKSTILHDLNFTLPQGSRCLLIGANGSGKSTLMRILAGRHLTSSTSHVKVLGLDAFHDTRLNFHRAYLDCDWGMRNVSFVGAQVPLMADIPVYKMMEKLQSSYPERRTELINMLGINLYWRMNQLSDGQRRRVQIFLCLLRPFHVLLLDEVTISLDVCVRQDLLKWLYKESIERKATIIYATHIFDGLDSWSSHLYYLTNEGKCGWYGTMEQCTYYQELCQCEQNNNNNSNGVDDDTTKIRSTGGKMLAIAERWLRAELNENRKRHIQERAQYSSITMENNVELYDPKSQGGYGSGRLVHTLNKRNSTATTTNDNSTTAPPPPQQQQQRQGRLSDMMGNAGMMNKVHRTTNNTNN